MKINKFFAASIIAAMALSSCAKEEPAGTTGSGEETFAGISISLPAPLVRGGAEADIATSAESIITKVGVFVVGDATVDKIYLTTASDFTFETSTGIATAKKAIRTTTGPKTIYVVANYTDALQTKIDAMGVAAFGQNAIALDDSNFMSVTGSTLNSLTMTGSVDHTMTVMSETDALLAINLVNVNVYRNLAKVIVRHATSTPAVPTGGKHQAGSLEFGLAAKANGAWLSNVQTTGSTAATASAYTGVPAAAVGDVSNAYWTNFSDNILGASATYKAVNAFNALYTAYDGFYCHENIYKDLAGGGKELYAGNTTSAHIRGKFIPNNLVTVYSATAGTRTSVDNSASTTAVSFYRLSDGTYWNESAYASATANSSDPFYINPSSFSAKYDAGMGYYRIIVMDGDPDRVPGVMRNNYYDMAINAIDGPGSPTEGPADETTPLDEESYISVKVSVKQWWKQTSGHTIQ